MSGVNKRWNLAIISGPYDLVRWILEPGCILMIVLLTVVLPRNSYLAQEEILECPLLMGAKYRCISSAACPRSGEMLEPCGENGMGVCCNAISKLSPDGCGLRSPSPYFLKGSGFRQNSRFMEDRLSPKQYRILSNDASRTTDDTDLEQYEVKSYQGLGDPSGPFVPFTRQKLEATYVSPPYYYKSRPTVVEFPYTDEKDEDSDRKKRAVHPSPPRRIRKRFAEDGELRKSVRRAFHPYPPKWRFRKRYADEEEVNYTAYPRDVTMGNNSLMPQNELDEKYLEERKKKHDDDDEENGEEDHDDDGGEDDDEDEDDDDEEEEEENDDDDEEEEEGENIENTDEEDGEDDEEDDDDEEEDEDDTDVEVDSETDEEEEDDDDEEEEEDDEEEDDDEEELVDTEANNEDDEDGEEEDEEDDDDDDDNDDDEDVEMRAEGDEDEEDEEEDEEDEEEDEYEEEENEQEDDEEVENEQEDDDDDDDDDEEEDDNDYDEEYRKHFGYRLLNRGFDIQHAIGGVKETQPWPWMVAIFRMPQNKFFCGGVLIDERHVITAAHCFASKKHRNATYEVLVGQVNIERKFGERVRVKKVRAHAQFALKCFCNDIALMTLETPVSPGSVPICMPTINIALPMDKVVLLGYGDTVYGGKSTTYLQRVDGMLIFTNEECRSIYSVIRKKTMPASFTEQFVCAGLEDGSKDACLGDSGGPLLHWDHDGYWSLVGIVSFGYKCGEPGIPGTYTRISHYLPWIQEKLRESEAES